MFCLSSSQQSEVTGFSVVLVVLNASFVSGDRTGVHYNCSGEFPGSDECMGQGTIARKEQLVPFWGFSNYLWFSSGDNGGLSPIITTSVKLICHFLLGKS